MSAERSPPTAGVQRDFNASAAPGLYIGMQEGVVQMHVWTVGKASQMAANGLADLARLEVRHDLVVQLHSDRVPSFACAHPRADMVPNAAGVRQYCGHVCAHGRSQVALLAEALGSAEVVHECLPVEEPREILCVVDTIEAVAVGQQQTFEGWQGGLQLFHRDFGHIHLCHKETGRFCLRVQLSPLGLRLFVGVELDPGDCRSDGTAFGVVSGCKCVDDVPLYVAASSAIGGYPHTLADGDRYPRNGVLRGAVLSGCAREAPAMDHAVLAAQVAKDIDDVDECRKAGEGAHVHAAQVACQIVNLGDVRQKIALVRVLQEKVGGYGLFGP